jgi:microcystin-dependent protein
MDPFLAEIRMFACNFAPKGWALCQGQILAISQNTALFSLLGTTYGGNGQTTFGLPDLRGNIPMHPGQGQLGFYDLGQQAGSETVTLLQTEMPAHTHTLKADAIDPADTNTPSPSASYAQSTGGPLYQTAATPSATLAPGALPVMGGNQPHNNLQPYLTVNYCIALVGIFPARG